MKKSLGPKTSPYPTPVLQIGTCTDTGRANAITASWKGICCSSLSWELRRDFSIGRGK